MIYTKDIAIPLTKNLTSKYIESKFKEMKIDVIKWSISGTSVNSYILTISIIGDCYENK